MERSRIRLAVLLGGLWGPAALSTAGALSGLHAAKFRAAVVKDYVRVSEGDRLISGDRHLMRTSGRHRIEADKPLAVLARYRIFRLAVEGYRHRSARLGRSPDGNWHVSLENHVLREQEIGLDLSCRGCIDR